MKTLLMRHLSLLGWLLRKGGPYLVIELVLPGGTLVALLLFLYQRHVAVAQGRASRRRLTVRRIADAASEWMRSGLQPALTGARELARARATF